MVKVKVYRFRTYDTAKDDWFVSSRMATREKIESSERSLILFQIRKPKLMPANSFPEKAGPNGTLSPRGQIRTLQMPIEFDAAVPFWRSSFSSAALRSSIGKGRTSLSLVSIGCPITRRAAAIRGTSPRTHQRGADRLLSTRGPRRNDRRLVFVVPRYYPAVIPGGLDQWTRPS